jgi:hypothetical protein
MKLSIITHTRNSAAHLPRLLDSTEWADERIIVDMKSTDATRDIAAAYGCRILEIEIAPRVDGVRNASLSEARGDWILVLDSDEYLAADAENEIARLIEEHAEGYDAFAIPRFNYIGDHIMRASGWYPDHQLRLFKRGLVKWSDSNHEPPTLSTGCERLLVLEPPGCLHIHHRNYRDLQEMIERQLRYAIEDTYSNDPETFDFQQSIAEAHAAFALRHQPEEDGELAKALSIVMAWDRLMRGLIQWDRLGRTLPLGDAYSLPASTLGPEEVEAAYRSLIRARRRKRLRALVGWLRLRRG